MKKIFILFLFISHGVFAQDFSNEYPQDQFSLEEMEDPSVYALEQTDFGYEYIDNLEEYEIQQEDYDSETEYQYID